MGAEKAGKLTIKLDGSSVSAQWRVVDGRVEVTSALGSDSAALGALASAPATVARETFHLILRRSQSARRPVSGKARLNVRDA
jgi:ABC-type taurine transport system substrate-binding protein